MKVTLLQTDIAWGDADENIHRAEQLMDSAVGSDLYVLPEMWSTGFATRPEGIAHDEEDNIALMWMNHIASERKCAICGSLAVRLTDGTYRTDIISLTGAVARMPITTNITCLPMEVSISITPQGRHILLLNMKGSGFFC